MKLRRIGLLFLPLFVLALAAPAWADGEEGAGGDLKEQIKKKMEGILELMKQNEAALLKLSTGQSAEPKKVDVDVPDPKAPDQPSGAGGSEGAAGGTKGGEVGKKLDELIRGQRESGGKIPDELKQLVEMIPL